MKHKLMTANKIVQEFYSNLNNPKMAIQYLANELASLYADDQEEIITNIFYIMDFTKLSDSVKEKLKKLIKKYVTWCKDTFLDIIDAVS